MEINQPTSRLVHPALTSAWAINPSMKLRFLFDYVSPARQFKRGTVFDQSLPFPRYDGQDPGDVTETDGEPDQWIPYMPQHYK